MERDHGTVPPSLSNRSGLRFRFSRSVVEDDRELIQPDEARIGTEDGVSKSFEMLSSKAMEHYIQPTDGAPLCFVAPCSANLPTHVQEVLYFFHRLDGFIKSHALNHYVVPTRDIQVERPREHPKDIRGLRYTPHRTAVHAEAAVEEENGAFDLSASFVRGSLVDTGKEISVDLPLLKIFVGFTGAVFDTDDGVKQELCCVVTVRPVRSFDVAAFIQGAFLSARKASMAAETAELRLTWTKILQYEANINCGLKGDPMEDQQNPYAPLGLFSVLSLLNVPLRIHRIVRTLHPGCTGVRIIGFPALSFLNGDEMNDYMGYLREYLLHGEDSLRELRLAIKTYASTKEDPEYEIKCPGGWPSRMGRDSADADADADEEVFKGWSVWRLPLSMLFSLPDLLDKVDRDTFLANMGLLPALAIKKMLDFKQAILDDPDNAGGCVADERVLFGTKKTLPYLRTMKYMGDDADPIKDLNRYGCMLPRFGGAIGDIRDRRASESITPSVAVKLLWRHMRSCMEYHEAMMEAGQYNSMHISQCHEVGNRLTVAPMGGVDLGAYLEELRRAKVDPRIRHDAYLSTCSALFLMLADLNEDFALNSVNLYVFFEMLISQIMYLVGGHDSTIHTFFANIEICGAQGHMECMDERNVVSIDNRKPNTTGAGILLVCINNLADLVADASGIVSAKNYLRTIAKQRSTPGALEAETCVAIVDGKITSVPPKRLTFCPQVSLEGGRGDTGNQEGAMVAMGVPRDDNIYTNVSTTSVDPEKTGVRVMQEKHQITYPNMCARATNCIPKDGEVPQSVATVSHLVPAGAPPFKMPRDDDNVMPNDIDSDVNSKRVKTPEEEPRKTRLAKFFALMFWSKVRWRPLARSGGALTVRGRPPRRRRWRCCTGPGCFPRRSPRRAPT